MTNCPKCGSDDVNMQLVAVKKSPLRWLLVFVPVIGWIILIVLIFTNSSKTVTKSLCQKCGKHWDVKQ